MTAFKNLSVSVNWCPVVLPLHLGVDHSHDNQPSYCIVLPWLQAQCQEVRKRKELELQILTEAIRLWEGEDIKTLGSVLYMSQAMVQNHGCEVRQHKDLNS